MLGGDPLVGAVVFGGVVGWLLVAMIGYFIQFVVSLVILGLIFLLAYLPVAYLFDWPPFS